MFLVTEQRLVSPLVPPSLSLLLHLLFFIAYLIGKSLTNTPISPINDPEAKERRSQEEIPPDWLVELAIRSRSLSSDPPHQTLMRSNQPPGKRMDPARQQRAEETQ
ncbi:hypothetical protein AVEN_131079-1 [Araneus ventricosus]|uniref:Uncharacterized protein n=1 Tax=Araneus ventricosus TaxID=182803 RepID=A0A4Y2D110_ARAVE|nr:hypothetical protein AVEN_131079-1 [Araneus ventricosus]